MKTQKVTMYLTILEGKTRYTIVLNIVSKTMDAFSSSCSLFGEQCSQVFKTITADNGSEFADLSIIKS